MSAVPNPARGIIVVITAVRRVIAAGVDIRRVHPGVRRIPVRVHLVQRLVDGCRPGCVCDTAAATARV